MSKKKISDSEYDSYFKDLKGKKKKGFVDIRNKKVLLIGGGIIFVLLLAFIIYIISGLPSLEELENPKPQLASKVYSIDGEMIGRFYIENRIETDIDSLPPYIVEDLVSTEVRRFYDHW